VEYNFILIVFIYAIFLMVYAFLTFLQNLISFCKAKNDYEKMA